jgi:uncharacterized coiled-coil protein SlyX
MDNEQIKNRITELEKKLEETKSEIESLTKQLANTKQKDINTWYSMDDGLATYTGRWENGL